MGENVVFSEQLSECGGWRQTGAGRLFDTYMLMRAKVYRFLHFPSYESSSANSEDEPRANYKQTQLLPDEEVEDSAICEFLMSMSDLIESGIDVSVCCRLGH